MSPYPATVCCLSALFSIAVSPVHAADNAKVSGRAWVFGDITVSGNARVLEAATVTTTKRLRGSSLEGRAEINGSAVIKGDPNVWLCGNGLTITGGVVVDHTADLETRESGVFEHGRFCSPLGETVSLGRWRYITPPRTGITGCRRKWTAPPRRN